MNSLDWEYSPFAKWFLQHKGFQFVQNGKPLPKYIAWRKMKSRQGMTVIEKPGWANGKMIDKVKANKYLNDLHY
jgi:hypothetical protein